MECRPIYNIGVQGAKGQKKTKKQEQQTARNFKLTAVVLQTH